jgi:hypothetical protein
MIPARNITTRASAPAPAHNSASRPSGTPSVATTGSSQKAGRVSCSRRKGTVAPGSEKPCPISTSSMRRRGRSRVSHSNGTRNSAQAKAATCTRRLCCQTKRTGSRSIGWPLMPPIELERGYTCVMPPAKPHKQGQGPAAVQLPQLWRRRKNRSLRLGICNDACCRGGTFPVSRATSSHVLGMLPVPRGLAPRADRPNSISRSAAHVVSCPSPRRLPPPA